MPATTARRETSAAVHRLFQIAVAASGSSSTPATVPGPRPSATANRRPIGQPMTRTMTAPTARTARRRGALPSATEDGAVLREQVRLVSVCPGRVRKDLAPAGLGSTRPAEHRLPTRTGDRPLPRIRQDELDDDVAAGTSAVVATTPIGLYIAIAPSVGQTSVIGDPFAMSVRAELSRVMPAMYRPLPRRLSRHPVPAPGQRHWP